MCLMSRFFVIGLVLARFSNGEDLTLRKCCPQHQVQRDLNCTKSSLSEDVLSNQLQRHNFIGRGTNITWTYSESYCPDGYQSLIPEDEHHLEGSNLKDATYGLLTTDFFCFEILNDLDNSTSIELIAVVCFKLPYQPTLHSHVGMIISMPFLFITFMVYLLLPDRNLHQKALMFYVLALLFAYILLVTINLSPNFEDPLCSIFGYTTVFSFMVSFFWMNVICFDIWYTFSGGRGFAGSKKTSERKRLIVYAIYAFGVPLLLIVLIYVLDRYLPENSQHRPRIGNPKCFISDGWPNLWYFYGEAGILVLANIIFFVLTALRIRKVKQETSMLKHSDSKRHSYEKDKQKFNLYVKLLFAMGVNWSMEVISWLVNWRTEAEVQYIFYITDFFNAVYGVWIFFIFVFKRKIWKLLKKRFNSTHSQETVHTGSSSVPSTSVSNIKAASR